MAAFRWHDGERTVVFGRGALGQAEALLGSGYVLLSTPRAAKQAPDVVNRAAAVHEVARGRVDELADLLRPQARGELLVALGGGRVIDVTKALAAAAASPCRAAAIPTTLSGAEMTTIHRHATGVPAETKRVRPAIVINDPELSASQPPNELAQSAANALGHAAEGPLTPLSNPVATLAAHEAARLIARGLPPRGEREDATDRDALALGALLAGYVIDSTGYGLHHVLSQTLVRFAGIGHGAANAVMLPHSLGALGRRSPEAIAALGEALGEDPARFAARVCALTGATRLHEFGVTEQQLDQCAEEAAERAELNLTPPPAQKAELRQLYAAAY